MTQAEVIRSEKASVDARSDLRINSYDPLQTCPPEMRQRYKRMAGLAGQGRLPAMVRLKCLECCCWSSAEVRSCEITGCALWVRARKGNLEA